MDKLKELVHNLDSGYGKISINKTTINNIDIELGKIAISIDNTDMSDITKIGIAFHEMAHKIQLLSVLLRYTTKDMNDNFNEICEIKDALFQSLMDDKEGKRE